MRSLTPCVYVCTQVGVPYSTQGARATVRLLPLDV